MPNRLARETSPYLLQHRDNPVDWYPWGPEALERARAEDKPILLSIGYSACHWCHVMAHESFEDPAIARLMNDHFINIKVDREERPDLDSLYMAAVTALTGQGGWPMTVFLTPDGRPFFGGTYFPPAPRYGHAGFPAVLTQVAEAYRERRAQVEEGAGRIFDHLRAHLGPQANMGALTPELLDQAVETLRQQFDPVNGGFGGAPKFPPAMTLEFLLRAYRRAHRHEDRHMVELTLDQMAAGGLYDHLGGGFHRYSVDEKWLVPHFEKMLYDNALLSRLYVLAHQALKKPEYREVAEATYDWVIREMTSPEGGFYSTLDADSEGEEGKFYVWTPDEVARALDHPAAAKVFNTAYDITPEGNFEGKSIPNLLRPLEKTADGLGYSKSKLVLELAEMRPELFDVRSKRVPPGRDEKILTAWNGMMMRSFAEAARVLDREDYRQVAVRNAEFLLTMLRRDGKLLRTFKDGQAKYNAYLEDYANLIDGLLALYEATFDQRWMDEAHTLAATMIDEFWDEDTQRFYDTGKSHEALIARPQERFDNATPAGNSVACEVLVRLSIYLGDHRYRQIAMTSMESVGALMRKYPNGFGRLLCALDFALAAPKEIAIIGRWHDPSAHAMVQAAFSQYAPHKVVAGTEPDGNPGPVVFLRGRPAIGEQATAYVCTGETCGLPLTDPESLAQELGR
ncbi:MAG TPA: thioredoxin domain-containing protein [Stenomitos sp.]